MCVIQSPGPRLHYLAFQLQMRAFGGGHNAKHRDADHHQPDAQEN
jgi:hypothetical protein